MGHTKIFDACSSEYLSGRPTYRALTVHRVKDCLGYEGLVADLGAGNGQLTALLCAAGVNAVAVDSSLRMLLLAPSTIPRVQALVSDLPFQTASLDGVVAATAFHWFCGIRELTEIRRVLKPGRRLVLTWNVPDEAVPFVAALRNLVEPYAGDTPRFVTMAWKAAIEASSDFSFIDAWEDQNPSPTTPVQVQHRTLSTSFVSVLPDHEREDLKNKIEGIVRGLPEHFEYPYVTKSYVYEAR